VRAFTIDPRALGIPAPPADALRGGDAAHNAALLRAVLEGEAGPRREIVVLNAAGALFVAGAAPDLAGGLELARRSLDSGAAKAKLAALVEASRLAVQAA
jgi:anthranilate phosphoribosyltransferase